ncbi:MAG: hypothetical protein WC130_03680 [Kiritimatiellia bacterium]
MTHPDLDKLEAALKRYSNQSGYTIAGPDAQIITQAARSHFAAQKYIPPEKSEVMAALDELEALASDGMIADVLANCIRAHLAAQRQGGDADDELFNLLADIARHKDAMPEAPYKTADMETWSHKKQSLVSRVWETVNWTRYHPTRETVRKALKSHPPAVTGDRGALEALDRITSDAMYGIGSDDHELMNPESYSKAFNTHCDDVKTVRAALLSAQAGVPGDVVEKVYQALRDARITFMALKYHLEDDKDIRHEVYEKNKEAIELCEPYLNNGRGGK